LGPPSFDVPQALARGVTVERYGRATCTQLRALEFEVAKDEVELFRELPGFEDFDPEKEVLKMLKSIYGFNDAPGAWRKRLHQVLAAWLMTQLLAEPEPHEKASASNGRPGLSIEERLQKEKTAATEEDEQLCQKNLGHVFEHLKMVLSTHVDDLKGAGKRDTA